jgi:hypothetical protein
MKNEGQHKHGHYSSYEKQRKKWKKKKQKEKWKKKKQKGGIYLTEIVAYTSRYVK